MIGVIFGVICVKNYRHKITPKSGNFVKKPGRTWQGCYAYVRHPMYTALWLWALGNALLWHGAALWIQAFFW